MQTVRAGIRSSAALLAIAAAAGHAAAPAWPEKPVRIIVPWAPGGSTDIVARLLAAELSVRTKQQFIVDNRAGAGGIVGMQIATAAPVDGHTLMLTSTAYGFLIDKPKVPVDLTTSFEPAALIGFSDSALVIHPQFPVRSVADFIALAKRRPGEINYASSGVGGFPHLITELLNLRAGIRLVHVPFKGGGPALLDVVAGHTQLYFGTLVTAMGQINNGRLRLLALGSPKRSASLPEVPTIGETVPGYEANLWWGVFAPRGTAPALVERIHAETMAVLASPELQKKLDEQGGYTQKMSAAEFAKLMLAETAKWAEVIRKANIRAE
ncbi:MAG: tripartite tricarboxylate transporter substrate binding protein [Acidobacteria bacterium]|nr:tripartite tricarboxylate transporter substrate binding protein [Acidobacteriota bacterium]